MVQPQEKSSKHTIPRRIIHSTLLNQEIATWSLRPQTTLQNEPTFTSWQTYSRWSWPDLGVRESLVGKPLLVLSNIILTMLYVQVELSTQGGDTASLPGTSILSWAQLFGRRTVLTPYAPTLFSKVAEVRRKRPRVTPSGGLEIRSEKLALEGGRNGALEKKKAPREREGASLRKKKIIKFTWPS